jgi:DNA-binding CsgD family transcriptional regulator
VRLRHRRIRRVWVRSYPADMTPREQERADRHCDGRANLPVGSVADTPSAAVGDHGFGVPEQIADSWLQSAALGLRPDRFDPPRVQGVELDSPFLRAAMPIIDRLGVDLASTRTSAVLATGDECRIVARRSSGPSEEMRLDDLKLSQGYEWALENVGINGLGAAMNRKVPTLIQGIEHFADKLATMATAGAPIRDPRSGRVVGVLALVCPAVASNQLLLPLATRAAREIEHRLLSDTSSFDRLVHAKFLDARRRTRSPLAGVSRTALLVNSAAARHLREADRAPLWACVTHNLGIRGTVKTRFSTADGCTLNLSLEPILEGGEVAGALIRFAAPGREASSPRSRAAGSFRPAIGWASLTVAEHSVIELVATGLTNREVAVRLFLSIHTVDSHLRHVYSKLDINSRVDLVRMVTAQALGDPPMATAANVA